MKNFQSISFEAGQYGITVRERGIYIQFVTSSKDVVSWMAKDSGKWKGFTSEPKITGVKFGTKAQVAEWCLDWAANGF